MSIAPADHCNALASADANILGSPAYMGGGSAHVQGFHGHDVENGVCKGDLWRDMAATGLHPFGRYLGNTAAACDVRHSACNAGRRRPSTHAQQVEIAQDTANRLGFLVGAAALLNVDEGLDVASPSGRPSQPAEIQCFDKEHCLPIDARPTLLAAIASLKCWSTRYATVDRLADAAHCLAPAEVLLCALADGLANHLAPMACRSSVGGTATPAGALAGYMGSDAPLAALRLHALPFDPSC